MHQYQRGIIVLGLATFMGLASVAAAQELNVQQQGEAYFVTGGIGEAESNVLENVKQDYNLHLMSSEADGAFTGNSRIEIINSRGEQIVSTESGPLFYANVPAGKYTVVQQMADGTQQTKKVTVGTKRPTNVHFVWK